MTTTGLTQRISSHSHWRLHNVAQTQFIEHQAKAHLPAYSLMARAGLATAQLALAIAPHGKKIWIACGPGNNGGDGLESAALLQTWGKQSIVTWLGKDRDVSADTQKAWQRAKAAGVTFADEPPKNFDLAIDAILGIGIHRTPEVVMEQWLSLLQASNVPVLCVDIPTGLMADTGEWLSNTVQKNPYAQRHTLSVLTLKPGLFTASGRDAAGQVWFNDLGVQDSTNCAAWLQQSNQQSNNKLHNSHKGCYGDVAVIGGAAGMSGAAMLASVAALHGGAGRVFVGLLDDQARHSFTAAYPALMVRVATDLPLKNATVVCGCGAGSAIHTLLPKILTCAQQLVLDADALNVLAHDTSLQTLLKRRSKNKKPSVLTPHPLEAARLLNCSVQDVQTNRLLVAQQLSEKFECVIVLKGSGSIIASPFHTPVINGSGNALLATAGTGDVLSGLIGAYIARDQHTFEATCRAVFAHGHVADNWPSDGIALDATSLARSVH